MKTERRHELERNQLADTLGQWVQAATPYSRAITAGLIGAVVLLFVWGFLAAQNRRAAAEGWDEYFVALSSPRVRDELAAVVDRHPDTTVGHWARLELADLQLNDGTNQLLADKALARDKLKQAAEKYQAVLNEARENLLLERATYGLARAREALGSLEEARKDYRSLVTRWPDSPYAATAKSRANDLDKQDTKVFYDWLAQYEPPRRVSGEPGTPGARPDFLKEPFDENILKLPSSIDGSGPGISFPSGLLDTPSSEGETKPAEGEAKPEVTQPADESK